MSKGILKYQVSMLTWPYAHPTYLKIHFRITRTLNPLSQLYINWKFQKYISVSVCPCHRASFMRSLFIAFKNNEWCHFVVLIGSLALISFYCECVLSFYFSLFSYFFCGVHKNTILIIKQWSCPEVPEWSFEEWIASACSN